MFDSYFLTDTAQKTYGAMYEPSGLLYGETPDTMTSSESMMLIYLDYDDSDLVDWVRNKMKKAQNSGKAVEFALNFSGAAQMKDVMTDKSFLKKVAEILNEYSSVQVYLRIGAEMNVWSTLPDASEYKKEFIEIADYIRSKAPRTAIMWSVAHTSAYGADFRDYYPGDEYVDRVGVNAYANKYYNASDASWYDQAYFHTGDFADPSIIVREVIEGYGDRKPIMIAESGVSYLYRWKQEKDGYFVGGYQSAQTAFLYSHALPAG